LIAFSFSGRSIAMIETGPRSSTLTTLIPVDPFKTLLSAVVPGKAGTMVEGYTD
jgi:hypothetical protein